jgi:hypothetical protein
MVAFLPKYKAELDGAVAVYRAEYQALMEKHCPGCGFSELSASTCIIMMMDDARRYREANKLQLWPVLK